MCYVCPPKPRDSLLSHRFQDFQPTRQQTKPKSTWKISKYNCLIIPYILKLTPADVSIHLIALNALNFLKCMINDFLYFFPLLFKSFSNNFNYLYLDN